MSLNGIAKGTELESLMKNMMQAEANGTMMYYALAQLAREQGLDDVAEGFITAANEAHYIAGMIDIIDTLQHHLIARNISCIFYDFRKYKYAFALKLLQCLICNFSCQSSDRRKGVLFMH